MHFEIQISNVQIQPHAHAQIKTTGPAAGNGYEIILQGFNWESCKDPWYRKLVGQAREIAEAGFTAVWLPPPTDSVSSQVWGVCGGEVCLCGGVYVMVVVVVVGCCSGPAQAKPFCHGMGLWMACYVLFQRQKEYTVETRTISTPSAAPRRSCAALSHPPNPLPGSACNSL